MEFQTVTNASFNVDLPNNLDDYTKIDRGTQIALLNIQIKI
jgi:hypothetical protein